MTTYHNAITTLRLACCAAMLVVCQATNAQNNAAPAADEAVLKLQEAKLQAKKGNLDTAEVLYREALQQASQTGNNKIFIQAELSLGRSYADKGDNVKAFSEYLLALKKAESIDDKSSVAHAYKNIGALYISWKKFDQAIAYYEKAEAIAKTIGENELVADCQNNKGTVYEQQLKYDKAIVAYKNALDVYTKADIKPKISMALSNLAIVYKFQKDLPRSLEYDLKAIDLSKKTGDNWMLAATYNNTGNVYNEMGDTGNALLYAKKGVELAKQINAMEIVESAYESISDIYAKAGDYKRSLEYHRLYSQANLKFINLDNTRQLSELNVKYETAQKQKLIQQQQFEISQKNYWLYGSVITLVLVAVVAYLVVKANKLKQAKVLQAQAFHQQEMASRALFAGEQKERIRIARDLHDSIGQMLSVIKMNMSVLQYQNQGNDVLNNTIEVVDKTISEVRDISHDMLPESLSLGLLTALDHLCKKISMAGITNVELVVDDSARAIQLNRTEELSIYRVIQEVLNNMLKHAYASAISIAISLTSDKLQINIDDNGRGFDTTTIHTSTGIGWKNIIARVSMLRGTFDIASAPGKGTQVDILVPAT